MKIIKTDNYSEDDSTATLQIISAITAEGCIVSEREYEYEVIDENDINFGATLTGIEITMSVPKLSAEEQVYRTLEELAKEVKLALVENND